MLTRKQQLQKEKKIIFAKEIVLKNPIFSLQHIEEFYQLFQLYVDSRTKRVNIKDIINTAKTLGLDTKYRIVYDALILIGQEISDELIDFETFLNQLTIKLGNPYDEQGRRAIFNLVDPKGKQQLDFEDLKRISQQLRFNLSDEDIREVINNVSGYGAKQITFDRFNKYIQKKIDKRKQ